MIPAASVLRVGTAVVLGFHIFNITCVEESTPAVTSATLENNGHDILSFCLPNTFETFLLSAFMTSC